MTIFTEPRLDLEFLVSEAPGYISRDTIVIASGSGVVVPGTLLGQKNAASSAVKASGANTGNGTLTLDGSTPTLAGSIAGTYAVRFTSATAFSVTDPNGNQVGSAGTVGTPFASQVHFNTAAGGTPFVAGDGFDIAVAVKYVPAPATAADGSSIGQAINLRRIDTTNGDVSAAAITSNAEVVGAMLTYDASVTTTAQKAAKAQQLGSRNIKVR